MMFSCLFSVLFLSFVLNLLGTDLKNNYYENRVNKYQQL